MEDFVSLMRLDESELCVLIEAARIMPSIVTISRKDLLTIATEVNNINTRKKTKKEKLLAGVIADEMPLWPGSTEKIHATLKHKAAEILRENPTQAAFPRKGFRKEICLKCQSPTWIPETWPKTPVSCFPCLSQPSRSIRMKWYLEIVETQSLQEKSTERTQTATPEG